MMKERIGVNILTRLKKRWFIDGENNYWVK